MTDLVNAEQFYMKEQLTDVMIASTSHDMKTPLNSIMSMADLIIQTTNLPKVMKWGRITKNSA